MTTGAQDEMIERIDADVPALSALTEKAGKFLQDSGQCSETANAIQTAIEELASNAIKYSPPEDGVAHWIQVHLKSGSQRVELVVEDNGGKFDPTTVAKPQLGLSLEETKIGGLGLHLVRSLTSGMAYERRNGVNRTTVLWKRMSAALTIEPRPGSCMPIRVENSAAPHIPVAPPSCRTVKPFDS